MRSDAKPMDVFLEVLSGIKAPVLTPYLRHSEVVEHFAFVAVRDALVELNVGLARAEDLAKSQCGAPRARFRKCATILGLELPKL